MKIIDQTLAASEAQLPRLVSFSVKSKDAGREINSILNSADIDVNPASRSGSPGLNGNEISHDREPVPSNSSSSCADRHSDSRVSTRSANHE